MIDVLIAGIGTFPSVIHYMSKVIWHMAVLVDICSWYRQVMPCILAVVYNKKYFVEIMRSFLSDIAKKRVWDNFLIKYHYNSYKKRQFDSYMLYGNLNLCYSLVCFNLLSFTIFNIGIFTCFFILRVPCLLVESWLRDIEKFWCHSSIMKSAQKIETHIGCVHLKTSFCQLSKAVHVSENHKCSASVSNNCTIQ